jgi:hypothetical protein
VDVLAALAPIARAFTFLGVRYYVGGSLASSVRGVPRSSLDVDVAAELLPRHVAPLVSALAREYYVSGERVKDAVEARRSFNAIHLASMISSRSSSTWTARRSRIPCRGRRTWCC